VTASSDTEKKRIWPYAAGAIIIGLLGGFIFSSGAYIGFAFQNWDDGLIYISLGTSGLIAASAYGFAFGQARESRDSRATLHRLEQSLTAVTPATIADEISKRIPGIDEAALATAIATRIQRVGDAADDVKGSAALPKLKPWVRRLFFE